MNMVKYQTVLFFLLVSMALPAQKKKNKEAVSPPKKVLYSPPTPKEPMKDSDAIGNNVAFRWKSEPETLTTFTPNDLMEKLYNFNGLFNVRIMSSYPLETISYKKSDKGEDQVVLLGYNMKYDDYDTVELKGNKIFISDKQDPKKEKIILEVTKKGNEIIKMKEVKTGRVFKREIYSPPPSM